MNDAWDQGRPKGREWEKRGQEYWKHPKRWLPGSSVFQLSDCGSLLTIPLHVFKGEWCTDEEPCSADGMGARPFGEGCDPHPCSQRKTLTPFVRLGQHLCSFPLCVWIKAGAQGPRLGKVLRQVRLQSFLIKNRNEGKSLSCRCRKKTSDTNSWEWLPLGRRPGLHGWSRQSACNVLI